MSRPLNDSEYLYGFHDPGGEHVMLERGIPGWVLFTEALGFDPNDHSGRDYTGYTGRGLGIMVRLNGGYHGMGTIPHERHYADFARRCANFVRSSQGARIWIVGNEMNHPIEWPGAEWNWNVFPPAPVSEDRRGEAITPQRYVRCYRQVRDAIRSLPGHAQDLVLVGAAAPWNPLTRYEGNPTGDWVLYFRDVLLALGPGQCDGITLHAYTHGTRPEYVTSDEKMTSREFAHRHWHFRAYRDFMHAIPDNMRHLPVFITEADQDDPWEDRNNGWVRAAYAEIDAWNRQNGQKIRSLLLYRWPRVGEDRWFIAGKEGVVQDFRESLAAGYKWSQGPAPDTGLAERWQRLQALEARFDRLAAELTAAAALSRDLKTYQQRADDLSGQVEQTLAMPARLQEIAAELARLEADAPVTPPPPGAGASPAIQDLTATLPSHPTLTWQQRPRSAITRIVIHHTATRADITPQRLAEVNVAQAKPGIAYHYLVSGEGDIYATQPLESLVWQTANSPANLETNASSVAVVLAGYFYPDRDVQPSDAQRLAAAQLIAWLMRSLNLGQDPEAVVFGRNELGENVGSPGSQWLGGVRYKDRLLADVARFLAGAGAEPEPELERLRGQVRALEAEIAAMKAQAAALKAQADLVPGLQNQVAQLQATVTTRDAEIRRLMAAIDAECGGGARPVPRPDVVNLIAELKQHPTKTYYNRTQRITSIVVHHTTGSSTVTPEGIARYHVESRDWPGVGYHYIIGAAGAIYWCQKHETHSWHAGAANGYALGVSLVGTFMNGALPTAAQMDSASRLIAWLMQEYGITDLKQIIGHKEAPDAATACPGDQWTAGAYWKRTLHDAIEAARTRKPILYYLLLWDHGNSWAEADWRNAQGYIAHFRPTIGFSVQAAMLARHVIIVGGPAGVTGHDEATLRAAGVDVHRLAGADEAATRAMLDNLVAKDMPWPGASPRGAGLAAAAPAFGASPAATDSLRAEPETDEWTIPQEWLDQEMGRRDPVGEAPRQRVRVESLLFPQH